MKEKKRNRMIGVLLVLASVVIVIIGAVMNREETAPEIKRGSNGFITTMKEETTTAMSPGKFSDVTQAEELTVSGEPKSEETKETEKASVASTAQSATQTTAAATTEKFEYEYAYAGFQPVIADMDIDEWNLLLVNRDFILPDGYMPTLTEAVIGSGVHLDSRVSPHYRQMYAAAKEDGITLVPLSGYRRVSRQKTNFENKIQSYIDKGYSKAEATQLAAQIILPPGTSEHNAGLAMDICSLDVSFENTKEFEWLTENAEDFGFILRYPKDKTDITKITYEPWHWRYVGVGHAKMMNEKGICLEEYLGMR